MTTLTRPHAQQIARQTHLVRERMGAALARSLEAFFAAQAARVVTTYRQRHAPAVKRAGQIESKQQPDPNELLPHSELQRLQAVCLPYLSDAWLEQADVTGDLFDLPAVSAEDLRLQVYLNAAGTRIQDIHEGTLSAVREVLDAGAAAGYSDYQIAHGVPKDGFRGLQEAVTETYSGRAATISRTEMALATNDAATERYREGGVREVEASDGDEDPECAERDGQTFAIDDAPVLAHPNCSLVLMPIIAF